MCGIDFVTPLQGLMNCVGHEATQGVALGCHAMRLRRAEVERDAMQRTDMRFADMRCAEIRRAEVRPDLVRRARVWHVEMQRDIVRPERPSQDSPGQSEATP